MADRRKRLINHLHLTIVAGYIQEWCYIPMISFNYHGHVAIWIEHWFSDHESQVLTTLWLILLLNVIKQGRRFQCVASLENTWKPYNRLTQALWVKMRRWNFWEAVDVVLPLSKKLTMPDYVLSLAKIVIKVHSIAVWNHKCALWIEQASVVKFG